MKSKQKLISYDNFLIVFLGALLFGQYVFILYCNCTQLQYHLGFDASSYYLKAYEMWKNGSLICNNWVDQTTLYWDSSVPIAALLMNFFGNIFVSYGVANSIIYTLILVAFVIILKQYHVSKQAILIALNMISCPYIGAQFNNQNAIGYFCSTFTSGNWYGAKILIMLLFIIGFNFLRNDKLSKTKVIALFIFAGGLFLISGISSGYYLAVTILLPAIIYGLINMFKDNEIKRLVDREMIFTYATLGMVLIGKYLATHLFNFVSKDSNMVMINVDGFWKNLGSIFLGYLSLLRGIPYEENVMVFSKYGIMLMVGLAIAVITIIGLFGCVYNCIKKKEKCNDIIFLFLIIITNILLFTVIYTTYSGGVFEERYLIIIFYAIVICLILWIDRLDSNLLFKKFGCLVLVCLLLCNDTVSDYKYYTTKIDTGVMDGIKQVVAKKETSVVYFYGDEYGIFQRNMRAYDTNAIYKMYLLNENGDSYILHWGDYTYYDYKDEWKGGIFLITTKDNFEKLSPHIQESFQVFDSVNENNIYYSESNVLGADR